MRKIGGALSIGVAAMALSSTATAVDYTSCDALRSSKTLNPYIKCAVDLAANERANGGYNIRRSFTNDLKYGANGQDVIQASRKSGVHIENGKEVDYGPAFDSAKSNPSMCVAAVAEILIEATNFYAAAHGPNVYEQVPASMWRRGDARSLRSYVYQFRELGARGAAHAAQRFGMGREKLFNDLNPYDVIAFNRTGGSGHSAIFIAYLSEGGQTTTRFSDVVGFRYFSIQNKGRPDAGFGYKNAYFDGHCPSPRGRDDDCNVIKGYTMADGRFEQDQRILNTGEFYSGNRWKVKEALATITAKSSRSDVVKGLALPNSVPPEAMAENLLSIEYEPRYEQYEDGSSLE
jgi:hypothetical protein